MADLFLTWEEAQAEQLPPVCVSCGARATEWADRQIRHTQYHFFSRRYTDVDVTLPVCERHRSISWISSQQVIAKDITEEGVVVGHVAAGFVEAVWDYRDDLEAQAWQGSPRQTVTPAPKRSFHQEDAAPASWPRRHSERRRYEHSAPAVPIHKIVLVVLGVIFLAPCGVMILIALLGLLLSVMVR